MTMPPWSRCCRARLSLTSFSVHRAPSSGSPRDPPGLRAVHSAHAPQQPRRFYFHGGWHLVLPLNGWLHDLDAYLFSAHMVQHLLLALVVAPLLLMGLTGEMLRPALALRGVGPAARWLTKPTHCFAIFNVVLAAWHLPPLYNYALSHHPVHIVQHLMFLAASVIMWWPVLSPLPELPRLNFPGQMLYLFLMSIPMAIVRSQPTPTRCCIRCTPLHASGITPMNDQPGRPHHVEAPGPLLYAVISWCFPMAATRRRGESGGAQVDWHGPDWLKIEAGRGLFPIPGRILVFE
jgi:putative membrane protein